MKVTSSRLIEQKKPVLKQLLDRLLQTYSYASILMTDSKGKQYTISKQGISITENMFVELGYVVKVYDGESYGEYAFSHIDENEIDSVAEEIKNHVMPWAKKLPDDMKVKQYPEIPDEAYHFEKSTDYEVLPEELGDEEIVKRLGAVREKAMAQDEKIVEIKTACVYQIYHKLFLSPNKDMTQNVMWTNGMIMGLIPKGEEMKMAFDSCSGCGGMEILDDMETKIPPLVQKLNDLATSEPITPGETASVHRMSQA